MKIQNRSVALGSMPASAEQPGSVPLTFPRLSAYFKWRTHDYFGVSQTMNSVFKTIHTLQFCSVQKSKHNWHSLPMSVDNNWFTIFSSYTACVSHLQSNRNGEWDADVYCFLFPFVPRQCHLWRNINSILRPNESRHHSWLPSETSILSRASDASQTIFR